MVHVVGWALADDGPVARVEITVDGRVVGVAGLCRPRPEIAAELAVPAARVAGFETWLELAAPGPGPASLGAVVTLLDGTVHHLEEAPVHLSGSRRVDAAPLVRARGPRVGRRRPTRPQPTRLLIWSRGLDLGGSQLRLVELVGALADRTVFETTVVSPMEGPLRPVLEAIGAEVRVEPPPPLHDQEAYERAVAAAAAATAGRFDLVYASTVTSFPAVEVAVRCGLPSVLRIGETEPLPVIAAWMGGSMATEVDERATAALLAANRVVANSEAVAANYGRRAPGARFEVVSTGAARHTATAPEARRLLRSALGATDADRLLVCPASVWPVKGQAALVVALHLAGDRAASLRCAFVGQQDAGYAAAVEHLVGDLGLEDRVVLRPFEDDLAPWYTAADAVVMPSEFESMSASILEAMAAGVPVLATAVGGTPEVVVPGRTGWLVPPGDLRALADGLVAVAAASDAQLRRLGRRARRVVRREHDRTASTERIAEVLVEARFEGPDPAAAARFGPAPDLGVIAAT